MSGSTASASGDPAPRRELVVSVNWIGDAIMAMPALQEYRRLHPSRHLAVLARGVIAELWALHAAPDRVIRYQGRPGLRHPLFAELRGGGFDQAWILPNSFRTAWIARRAGIPRRTGRGRGIQRLLVNDPRRIVLPPGRCHQAWEYLELMAPDPARTGIPAPRLVLPAEGVEAAWERHGGRWREPVVGMIPGAARGPSKRWPAEHFIAAGRMFRQDGFRIALFGGPDDRDVCAAIAAGLGGDVINKAGGTTLLEWATLMSACRLVVANDSGGMHLAAALDRPVVALYGMTDPEKTGPLGRRCRILQRSARKARDIARDSAEARALLAAITPGEVVEAARVLWSMPEAP